MKDLSINEKITVAAFGFLCLLAGLGIGFGVKDRDLAAVCGLELVQPAVYAPADECRLEAVARRDGAAAEDTLAESISIDSDLVTTGDLVLTHPIGTFVVADVPAEPMPCDKCGKNMIRRYTGQMMTSYPPQEPWVWWCACGMQKPGGVIVEKSQDELAKAAWNAAQATEASK